MFKLVHIIWISALQSALV